MHLLEGHLYTSAVSSKKDNLSTGSLGKHGTSLDWAAFRNFRMLVQFCNFFFWHFRRSLIFLFSLLDWMLLLTLLIFVNTGISKKKQFRPACCPLYVDFVSTYKRLFLSSWVKIYIFFVFFVFFYKGKLIWCRNVLFHIVFSQRVPLHDENPRKISICCFLTCFLALFRLRHFFPQF